MKAQMFNHSEWIDLPSDAVTGEFVNQLTDMLRASGFKILGTMQYHFQPQGFTAMWLLGESHLAIHTFPEEETCYLELSSCVKPQFDRFVELLSLPD